MSDQSSEEEEEPWRPIFLSSFAMVCLVVITWLVSSRVKQLWLKPKFARHAVEYVTLILLTASGAFVLVVIPLATSLFSTGRQCLAALIACLLFYSASKLSVVILLMEKAYVVNKGITETSRRHHPLYKFNIGLLFIYVAIFVRVVMESDFQMEDSCRLSYGETSVVVFFCYDILVGFYCTALFLLPLVRSVKVVQTTGTNLSQVDSIRKTIKSCFLGTVIIVLSSTINLIPVAIEGWQRAETCLFMCCLDVSINSVVGHYITPLARVREVSKISTSPCTTWATKPKTFQKESRVWQASSVRENVTPSEIIDEDSKLIGLSGV